MPKRQLSKKEIYNAMVKAGKHAETIYTHIQTADRKYQELEKKLGPYKEKSIDDIFGGYGKINSKNTKPGDLGHKYI